METLPELELLKAAFCQGDEKALINMMKLSFRELWANMLVGDLDEQADALLLVEQEIKSNATDFCNSKDPVLIYLRKVWKRKLAYLRKQDVPFDETYLSPITTDDNDATDLEVELWSLLPGRYFLSSLPPANRILYEVKYHMALGGKNGVFQVAKYLLNVVSPGNDELLELLRKDEALYEPVIPNILIKKGQVVFTNSKESVEADSFTKLLNTLKKRDDKKRIDIKKALHTIDTSVSRDFRKFKRAIMMVKNFPIVEQAILFMEEYLKIKDEFEVWVRLNVDALHNSQLYLELEALKLDDEKIKVHYISFRQKEIKSKLKLSSTYEKQIVDSINSIREGILSKVSLTDLWKTK